MKNILFILRSGLRKMYPALTQFIRGRKAVATGYLPISIQASKLFFWFCLFIVFFPHILFAQVADFKVKDGLPTSGCPPMAIEFVNLTSNDDGSLQYKWYMGDNLTPVTEKNPGKTYFNSGSYTVKLEVYKNGVKISEVSKPNFITVYASPVVDFEADVRSGCPPFSVQFTDKSTPGSGTLASWSWDFGDGHSSSLQNPSHMYTTRGNNNITLTVTNSNGCKSSLLVDSFIRSYDKLSGSIGYTLLSGCSFPFSIQLDNNVTGEGAISYLWDFGDGNTSADIAPSHTYAGKGGNYTVTLKAKNGAACEVTKTVAVKTDAVEANFTITPQQYCANTSYSFSAENFSGATYEWDWGDASVKTYGRNASHTYTTGGNYQVTLKVSKNACSQTSTQSITIDDAPKADFTVDDQLFCSLPATVNFTDLSTGVVTYREWSFGDGATSSVQDPSHTYATAGYKTVTLKVGNGVCPPNIKTVSNYINIQIPVVSINAAQTSLCTDEKTSIVVSGSYPGGIAGYRLLYHDGTEFMPFQPGNTFSNASFSAAGIFQIKVEMTTTDGCIVESALLPFSVGVKPTAQFCLDAPDCDIMTGATLQFKDQSLNATEWQWIFEDTISSVLQNPTHNYREKGNYKVRLIVWNNGSCPDMTDKFTLCNGLDCPSTGTGGGGGGGSTGGGGGLDVKGISALFNSKDNCNHTWKFEKKNKNETGVIQLEWLYKEVSDLSFTPFGTGQEEESLTFPVAGEYIVKLIAKSATQTISEERKIKIRDAESAKFKMELGGLEITSACKHNTITFTPTERDQSNIASYQWNMISPGPPPFSLTQTKPGGTTKDGVTSVLFDDDGTYAIYLRLTDSAGCVTNDSRTLIIGGPTAAFTGTDLVCKDGQETFTDASTSNGGNPIISWEWALDGTQVGTAQNLNYTFAASSWHKLLLTVADVTGCNDTISKMVYVSDPSAAISLGYSGRDSTCPNGNPVNFQGSSSGVLDPVYQWDLGDGNLSTIRNPGNHIYTADLTKDYTVSLVVAEKNLPACSSNVVTQVISVVKPVADFEKLTFPGECAPLGIRFQDKSSFAMKYKWDFGTGGGYTSEVANPEHNYNLAGDHIVKLVIESVGGCKDSITKSIHVTGANGRSASIASGLCVGDELTLQVNDGERIGSIIWDFDDGVMRITNADDSVQRHSYKEAALRMPRIILVSSEDPACKRPLSMPLVTIGDIDPAFSPEKSIFCGSGDVNFVNGTSSPTFAPVKTYTWNFGLPGDDYTGATPPIHNFAPGRYDVKLTAESDYCIKDTLVQEAVIVYAKPVAQITPLEACVLEPLDIAANLVTEDEMINYQWKVNSIDVSGSDSSLHYSFNVAGTYSIDYIVDTRYGCHEVISENFIAHPLPDIVMIADSVVCKQSEVQLFAGGGSQYLWKSGSAVVSNMPTFQVNVTEDTKYDITVTNSYGCQSDSSVVMKADDSVNLKVNKDVIICYGETAQLTAASRPQSFLWLSAPGLNDNYNSSPVVSPQHSTVYTVIGWSDNVCPDEQKDVRVYVMPNPTVNLGPDRIVEAGKPVIITPQVSGDVSAYLWEPLIGLNCPTCKKAEFIADKDIEYKLTVSTPFGCKASDNIRVFPVCDPGAVFIPSAFTPNGDGLNDVFSIRGYGIKKIQSFRIFDRWGKQVFHRENVEANDISAGWDGYIDGKLSPSATFVYIADIVCNEDKIFQLKGTVVLIR